MDLLRLLALQEAGSAAAREACNPSAVSKLAVSMGCLSLALLFFVAPALAADRTDIIVMKNGDRITGRIREVSEGILQLKSDHGSGRYNIYWDHVERIETKNVIFVELSGGERMSGSLTHKPDSPQEHVIRDDRGRERVFTLPEVSSMHEGDHGFWGRFDGSLDGGYTLTKSNDTQQISANGNLIYNTEKYVATAAISTLSNTQKDAPGTLRANWGGFVRRDMRKKWFGFGGGSFLHSDGLQLSLRSVALGGVGRYLKRDSKHNFYVGGGMAWNNEEYSDPGSPNLSTSEAVMKSQWDVYRVFGDDLDLLNQFTLYKGLSRVNRTRFDLDMEMRYTLPKHYYFNFRFSNNFDSSPPIAGTPRNDFVISSGFGWGQ